MASDPDFSPLNDTELAETADEWEATAADRRRAGFSVPAMEQYAAAARAELARRQASTPQPPQG